LPLVWGYRWVADDAGSLWSRNRDGEAVQSFTSKRCLRFELCWWRIRTRSARSVVQFLFGTFVGYVDVDSIGYSAGDWVEQSEVPQSPMTTARTSRFLLTSLMPFHCPGAPQQRPHTDFLNLIILDTPTHDLSTESNSGPSLMPAGDHLARDSNRTQVLLWTACTECPGPKTFRDGLGRLGLYQ
jgi:hypothetical protein